jgi:glycerate kinase
MTAAEVSAAIADGLARAGIDSDICRLADGGEGTLDVIAEVTAANVIEVIAHDALGREVTGRVAIFDGGKSALVEVADAIGLTLIAESERDPVAASSYGAGELIVAACRTGARDVFVGVGGTASTDGGAGALEALRAAGLVGKRGRLKGTAKLTVLCDVRASWEQAALVFARQKGADDAAVGLLAMRLEELAADLPQDPRGKLLTGAGGGLSGGLWAAAGADLKSGAAWVLDRLDFSPRMTASRAVITGEGSLDHQTLLGKAVGEVATRARQSGVPCHAIVGRVGMTEFEGRILDFESVLQAGDANAISAAAERLVPVLAVA